MKRSKDFTTEVQRITGGSRLLMEELEAKMTCRWLNSKNY
jgi:hypothetical protein